MKRFSLVACLVLALSLAPQVPPFSPQAHATAYSITAFTPSSSADYLPGRWLAGATLTAGQAVYIDVDVSGVKTVKVASSTGTGLATQMVGLAGNGAAVGQQVKIVRRDPALAITTSVAIAAGDIVILGVGGVLAPAADAASTWFVAVVGVGIGGNKMNFAASKYTNNYIGVMRADIAKP